MFPRSLQFVRRSMGVAVAFGLALVAAQPTRAGLFDPPPKPPRPTNLHVTSFGPTGANIKWSCSATDVQFVVWHYHPSQSKWVQVDPHFVNHGNRSCFIPRYVAHEQVRVLIYSYRCNLFGCSYSDWSSPLLIDMPN